MPLDYLSLLIAFAFAGGCLAITFFVTWLSARSEAFMFTWSVGTMLIVVSVFVYSAYVAEPRLPLVLAAFTLMVLGLTIVHAASVQFRLKRVSAARMTAIAAAALVVALAGFAVGLDGLGFILFNCVAAVLLFATAWQYRLARAEAPGATMGLAALYAIVGVTFLLCAAVLAADGSLVLGRAPENWAENLNLAVSIAALAGAGALSLSLSQSRLASSHRRDAETDVLTGLLNRRALFDMFRERRLPPLTSVVVFDLDRFKAVNDGHGHAVGDEVLRRFAGTLRSAVREIDTTARLGGEEFALILPRSESESALRVAERIRQAFAEVAVDAPAGVVRCTVSAGVATAREGGQSFEEVLRNADQALYVAKRDGRNRVVAEPLRLVG